MTQSSGAPPPPPPPPPPPLLINFSSDKVISDMKDVSSPDSRQNLLKDIRKGTNLKKVDANQTIATKPMDHSYEEPKSEPKGLIMTSLNTELQKFMRQRSQETMTYGSRGGPQSYYRWNNPMNEKNNSILNERTRFKSHIPPPVSPARPPPLTVQDFIDYSDSKNLIVESMDEIDSDFSDGDEEEVDTPDMERGDGLQLMERHRNSVPMNVTLSDGNNHIPIIHNKSQTIITDIFHMVHK
ncbi:unnamed protein product [Oppiella nova]|uniref:WH2 domain-containing protein n=1 Tax=Oppiella nova TaxID=334625 RepID=A0A7R9LZL9_9ACAR|nr:unnamed protein product [Oppiella nova]CAG2168236.1 unnamed protein product [Oppiella nova]